MVLNRHQEDKTQSLFDSHSHASLQRAELGMDYSHATLPRAELEADSRASHQRAELKDDYFSICPRVPFSGKLET